jgi:hypothetical protein
MNIHPSVIKGNLEATLKENFKNFHNKIDKIGGIEKTEPLSVDEVYRPHFACIWNDPNLTGEECNILGSDETISFVIFPKHNVTTFYRNIDLLPFYFKIVGITKQ